MRGLPAENIHERLGDLRNGTGKSQKEVADDLGIQASVLSRIERGETKTVSHDLVIKLAEYYDVPTDYLLCRSDIRIKKNVELEELGLTNKALVLLLQGKLNGKILSRLMEHSYFPGLLDAVNAYFTDEHKVGFASRNAMIEIGTASIKDFLKKHPEYQTEGMHDVRELNAEKVTGTEADIEKIKNVFLTILRDIKKEYDEPQSDISTEELKQQVNGMKEQALQQKMKKPKFNEMDMANLTLNMFQGNGMDLDEYEQGLFRELMVHMLQRKC